MNTRKISTKKIERERAASAAEEKKEKPTLEEKFRGKHETLKNHRDKFY